VSLIRFTNTPKAPVAGTVEGLPGATAEGVPSRVGEAAVPPVVDELQAPASAATTMTDANLAGARQPIGVFMFKGNDILRIGLRFRYDPAPEAGSPTLTPRASLEGVAVDGG
jgi:hypothetical protein